MVCPTRHADSPSQSTRQLNCYYVYSYKRLQIEHSTANYSHLAVRTLAHAPDMTMHTRTEPLHCAPTEVALEAVSRLDMNFRTDGNAVDYNNKPCTCCI